MPIPYNDFIACIKHRNNNNNNKNNNNKLTEVLRQAPCGLKLLLMKGRSETWDRTRTIRSIKDYTLKSAAVYSANSVIGRKTMLKLKCERYVRYTYYIYTRLG